MLHLSVTFGKSNTWYVITLAKRTLNLTTIRGNTLFGGKFGPKIKNCLFEMKSDT